MKLLTPHDGSAIHPPSTLVLQGDHARLVPLQLAHASAIQHWADEREEGFTLNLGSPADFEWSVEAFFKWLLERAGEGIVPFAVVEIATGTVIGYTRYLHVEPGRRALHIGGTWYAPPARGTVVNPECKLLLLKYAFEEAGFNRVQIQTDILNVRSQRAIARIGAALEGISRADYIRRDGTVRDTWVASIIRSEWPDVRTHLEKIMANASNL